MNWREWFPFENVRPAQQEALDFIVESWSSVNTVLLQLPTGVGKSGIAKTASRIAGKIVSDELAEKQDDSDIDEEPGSFLSGESTYLITPQKILQTQYLRDFPDIANVQNKRDYPCSAFDGNRSCADGYALEEIFNGVPFDSKEAEKHIGDNEELRSVVNRLKAQGRNCFPCKTFECAYRRAVLKWFQAPLSLTNTSFFLAASRGEMAKRKCLIVDEAHLIEDDLISFASISLPRQKLFEWYEIKVPKFSEFEEMKDWIDSRLRNAISVKIKILDVSAELALREDMREYSRISRESDRHREFLEKCDMIVELGDEDWVLKTDAENNQSIEPLHASVVGTRYLLNFGEKRIFMSGTLLSKDLFCETMGLEEDDVAYMELDSPFESEKRPVYFDPVGSMNRRNIDTTLPLMVEKVKEIMRIHKGEKGIIHTTTYQLSDYIKNNIRSNRLLFHDSNSESRNLALEKHVRVKGGTILVSPSMTTGVDLKGDLATFAIIVKVPWPYLGDERIFRLKEENPRWYAWKTVQQIKQACGRVIRDENDEAIVYILDADFANIVKYSGEFLLEWWTDALYFSDEGMKLVA